MAATVRCPFCNKSLPATSRDAGLVLLCSACGATFVVPPPQPPVLLTPLPDNAPASSPQVPDLFDQVLTSPPPTPPSATPFPSQSKPAEPLPVEPLPPDKKPWLLPLLLIAGFVAVLVLGLLLVFLTSNPFGPRPIAISPTAPPTFPQFTQPTLPSPQPPAPVPQLSPQDQKSIEQLVEAIETIYGALDDTSPRRQRPPTLSLPATRATQPAPPPPPVVLPGPLPPLRSVPVPQYGVTDEQIGRALTRGIDHLIAQFDPVTGQLKGLDGRPEDYRTGLNALCIFALLQAERATLDPRLNIRNRFMINLLDRLRKAAIPADGHYATYARGFRAAALAVHYRSEDRVTLHFDIDYLLRRHRNGAYSYGNVPLTDPRWDNSNSQCAVLGVWAAAEAGFEVPRSYWLQVAKHWTDCQLPAGAWTYEAGQDEGYLAMTAAGVASLLVTYDYLQAPALNPDLGRPPFTPALARGLAWLEQGDHCLHPRTSPGYTRFALERVGLASGLKYLGRHDWYRLHAAQVLARQGSDGALDSLLEESAFNLIFLSRGRHPILFNKLRFDGFWSNRSRDVANLARFASRELERPFNWQVVNLERDWSDWLDSPVLYLASHEPPKLARADRLKLRAFLDAGGLLFSHADADSPSFTQFITDLGTELYPDYAWIDLPPTHELYSLNYRINPAPPLRALSNGSRFLMIHAPADLSTAWQVRAERTQRAHYELAINIFLYAAGKTDLRNRLATSLYLPEPVTPPSGIIRLARIQYAGNWDPEPYAFTRFARWFHYQTGLAVQVASPIAATQLKVSTFPIAHLTGTADLTLSDAELAALKSYVESGGILLIDACGGADAFHASLTRSLLPKLFPATALAPLSPQHPLLAGSTLLDNLATPRLRPHAAYKLGKDVQPFHILSAGKGHVIYSSLDLTTALLNTHTFLVLGHDPAYAHAFLKNLLLWTASR